MIDIAHIHPMLVHFPLALLPVGLLFQLAALLRGGSIFERSCPAASGLSLLILAALGAVAAAVFGDLAMDKAIELGFSENRLETHEELGITSAVLLTALAAWNGWWFARDCRCPKLAWLTWATGLGVLFLILTTAWFGGELVYGLGVNVSRGG